MVGCELGTVVATVNNVGAKDVDGDGRRLPLGDGKRTGARIAQLYIENMVLAGAGVCPRRTRRE